jgi:hypothetical protein
MCCSMVLHEWSPLCYSNYLPMANTQRPILLLRGGGKVASSNPASQSSSSKGSMHHGAAFATGEFLLVQTAITLDRPVGTDRGSRNPPIAHRGGRVAREEDSNRSPFLPVAHPPRNAHCSRPLAMPRRTVKRRKRKEKGKRNKGK